MGFDHWSSRGIDQKIVLVLAERECNIIVRARTLVNTEKVLFLLKVSGVQIHAMVSYLADPAGVEPVIWQLSEANVNVDIHYNNAAIQNAWKPFLRIDMEEWFHPFQVNLWAVISLCIAFAPGMKKRGYGRIINLTSGIKEIPQLALYSVSMVAVDKYSRDLAAELAGPNAEGEVKSVLLGALIPARLEDNGPNGRFYTAQDYKELEY
jgi:3-oxoacyl-[acyl-carrier protein] reductase